MKFVIALICSLLFVYFSLIGQVNGELHLKDSSLTGNLDHPYFTGFTIELDTIYSKIDSTILFNQLPRIGTINFKNRIDIPTEYTITKRAGFAQIMFRFRTSYLVFDDLNFNSNLITFILDDDPKVPVTQGDLEIIRLTKKILNDEIYWNNLDDRNCDDDIANKSYSLYCAIKIASLEIENRYNHRNAVLQKLRHLIDEKYPGVKWKHRLMDFNNMDNIQYKDIEAILIEIEQDILKELDVTGQ